MISITSAPAAPPPRIRILDPSGGDVETVRIGDRLIFRIEIPGNSKYLHFFFLQICINLNRFIIQNQFTIISSSVRYFRPQLSCHGQRF